MGTEIEGLEERMKSFLEQLQAESGVFERMVYKNKNQHRRSSYFQYILKVINSFFSFHPFFLWGFHVSFS
uniref:Uncharacterized protein MANES_03G127300 n=1 Tax=Rhizophora mucronata TaxID=61149 RepID=A0A2P2JWH0_RHIMU